MPRPSRLEPAGVALHVIQRGNNRAACFFGEVDRRFYLKCLADAAERRGCAVHAYVLMTNHVHLLVTPATAGAVSVMMQDIGRRYVRIVNRAHGRTGTLWEGRFRSNLIDSENYLLACHRYIELNPVRAGIAARPADYRWSSHACYSRGRPDRLLTEHAAYSALGATADDRRKAFLSLFDCAVADDELVRIRSAVNKGWALGTEAFLDRMEAALGESVRPPRRGRPPLQPGPEPQRGDTQRENVVVTPFTVLLGDG